MSLYTDGFKDGWKVGYEQARKDLTTSTNTNTWPWPTTMWSSTHPYQKDPTQLKRILTNVAKALKEQSLSTWLETTIPALDSTPLSMIELGKLDELEKYVDTYFDPSYS